MDIQLEAWTKRPAKLDRQRDKPILNGMRVRLPKKHQESMFAEVVKSLERLLSRRIRQEEGEHVRCPGSDRSPDEVLLKAVNQHGLIL